MRLLRFAAAGAILLFAAFVERICYRRYFANFAIASIERRTTIAFDSEPIRASSIANANLTTLSTLRTGSQDDQGIAMAEAANFMILNRYSEAEADYLEALRWGERPEIYLNLATAQAAQGKRDAALHSLSRLLELDPFMLAATPLVDLRAMTLSRFESSASSEFSADVYLSLAIGYLENSYYSEAADAAARAALHDPSIFTRPEVRPWGPWILARAMQRYHELQNERPSAPPRALP